MHLKVICIEIFCLPQFVQNEILLHIFGICMETNISSQLCKVYIVVS